MSRAFTLHSLLFFLYPGFVTFVFSAVLRTSLPITTTDGHEVELVASSNPENITGSILENGSLEEFTLEHSLNWMEKHAKNSSWKQSNETTLSNFKEETSSFVVSNTTSVIDQLDISDTNTTREDNTSSFVVFSTPSVIDQLYIFDNNASGEENISGVPEQRLNVSLVNRPPEEDGDQLLADLELAILKTGLFDLHNDTFEVRQDLGVLNDSVVSTEHLEDECVSSPLENSSLGEGNDSQSAKPTRCVGNTSNETSYSTENEQTLVTDTRGSELNATEFDTPALEGTDFIVSETLQFSESISGINSESFTSTGSGNTLPTTEIVAVQERECPSSGICILWFLADDICSSDLNCDTNSICCKVGCSKLCVDAL